MYTYIYSYMYIYIYMYIDSENMTACRHPLNVAISIFSGNCHILKLK